MLEVVCAKGVAEPKQDGRGKGWCAGAFVVRPTQQAAAPLMIFSLQPIPGGALEPLLTPTVLVRATANIETIAKVVVKEQALARNMRSQIKREFFCLLKPK